MRLLLILALLIASVSFGVPANAHSPNEHAAHHSMPPGEHSGEEGQIDPLTHVCAGCAVVGQPALAELEVPLPALPPLLVEARSLSSFLARPIAPPPRRS